jgi:hypothetical protein
MADEKPRAAPETGGAFVPSRAKGSRKGEETGVPMRAAGRLKLKPSAQPDEPAPRRTSRRPTKIEGDEPQPRVTGRRKAKPSVDKSMDAPPTPRGDGDDSDQIPRRRRSRGAEPSSGYVRFRVHVEDGEATILDGHLVDGALAMPPTLHGEYAYEVTDGARLLHADTIPDPAVVRSFAHPSGTTEQRRHHTYRLSTYDVDVRVPAADLTRSRLADIAVVVYRVKEPAPARALQRDQPLGKQFERELREVTRVDGIPSGALPASLRGRRRRKS